jgi:hypothetical protein
LPEELDKEQLDRAQDTASIYDLLGRETAAAWSQEHAPEQAATAAAGQAAAHERTVEAVADRAAVTCAAVTAGVGDE